MAGTQGPRPDASVSWTFVHLTSPTYDGYCPPQLQTPTPEEATCVTRSLR